jgi:hypothetical protein
MSATFQEVSETELRERFNAGDFYFRSLTGELDSALEEEGHPSPGPAGEPFCTRSQIISYWDGGDQVARVHQYLRPDGDLGASGLPDPQMVMEDNVVYFVVK